MLQVSLHRQALGNLEQADSVRIGRRLLGDSNLGRCVCGLWFGGGVATCLRFRLLLLLFELPAFAHVISADFAVSTFLFLLLIRLIPSFLSPFSSLRKVCSSTKPRLAHAALFVKDDFGLDVLGREVGRLSGG